MTLLIRNRSLNVKQLFYTRLGEFWTKEEKLKYIDTIADYTQIDWQQLTPDKRNTWITEGLKPEFDDFLPIGTEEAKSAKKAQVESIFKTYSPGINSGRDWWIYNFNEEELVENIKNLIETYNEQVFKWVKRDGKQNKVDNFVGYDDKRLKWSETLKQSLEGESYIKFSQNTVRKSLYRPFTIKSLYFSNKVIDRCGLMRLFFPVPEIEIENPTIYLTGAGSQKPFMVFQSTHIVDYHFVGAAASTQCFPFYTYAEDGTERRENITDWALQKYRAQYSDETISKWDIFHYIYAVLHAPTYRQKYAANLKRDLPRIPFVVTEAFRPYVAAGAKLATLHRDYEKVTPYNLKRVENKDVSMNWRVDERGMRLSSDKTSLRYNEWLTLENIPARVFDYKLGNRSALDWVIDQYKVSTDARSGLHHDPNDPDDERAIVKLVGQVIQVSLETLEIIEGLPPLT